MGLLGKVPKNKSLGGGGIRNMFGGGVDPSIGRELNVIDASGLWNYQEAPPQPESPTPLSEVVPLADRGSPQEVAGWQSKIADAQRRPDEVDEVLDSFIGGPSPVNAAATPSAGGKGKGKDKDKDKDEGTGLEGTLGIINMGAGLGGSIYKMLTRKKPRRPMRAVAGSSGNPFR